VSACEARLQPPAFFTQVYAAKAALALTCSMAKPARSISGSSSQLKGTISDLYWQSSWPMDHRTWIAPRLYAPPTFAAYAENRDPALEAVLACDALLPGL